MPVRYRRGLNPVAKVFIILLVVALCISIAAAFTGKQPFAAYKDNVIAKLTPFLPQTTPESPAIPKSQGTSQDLATPKTQVTYELHGTYTATVGFDPFSPDPTKSVKRTLTFKGDTFTSYDSYLGKTICKYFIPGGLESGQVIIFTNIATGKEYTERFKYTAEYDCFTIGEGFSTVTYYKD